MALRPREFVKLVECGRSDAAPRYQKSARVE
jgi:hypothetical protein